MEAAETPAVAQAHEETIKRRKIAIIGTAPSSCNLAPYNDPTWEIWALKLFQVPRWDVFFEIHDATEGEKRWPKEYVKFLQTEHRAGDGGLKPLMTQGKVEQWPNSQPFPLQPIIKRFGNYFTNQVSYMLALAVMQHGQVVNGKKQIVEQIGLWGVDMAQHGIDGRSEYAHQRPSCEFFLGWAAGAGIPVYVPPQSDLLKTRKLYAFERDDFAEKAKARHKELQQRIQKEQQAASVSQRNADHLAGALDNMTWVMQWNQNGN